MSHSNLAKGMSKKLNNGVLDYPLDNEMKNNINKVLKVFLKEYFVLVKIITLKLQ